MAQTIDAYMFQEFNSRAHRKNKESEALGITDSSFKAIVYQEEGFGSMTQRKYEALVIKMQSQLEKSCEKFLGSKLTDTEKSIINGLKSRVRFLSNSDAMKAWLQDALEATQRLKELPRV
jgi:hypothetical protein